MVNVIQVGEVSYHINPLLKKHWARNSLKIMQKSNSDRVYIVDGMERSGKSWFAFQQMGFIDPSAFSSVDEMLKRVVFSPEEFFEAIRTLKNKVIIFDEAFRGFSSRSALSKVNKKLNQGLMEMGQNNNIVFIVLPRIFLLDIYPAMLRSHGLFNILINKKLGKRMFRGYNSHDKNQIYQIGSKKGWRYPIKTRFKGYFYDKFPGGVKFQEAYLKKKALAFQDMDINDEKKGIVSKEAKYKLQRDLLLCKAYKDAGSFRKAEQKVRELGLEMTHAEIRNLWRENLENLPDNYTNHLKAKGFSGKMAENLLKS